MDVPQMNAGSAGSAPPVESTRIVAMYEPATGRIRHLHSVTVLAGAEPVSEGEAIAVARERGARFHCNVEDLAIATSEDRRHLKPHRIDPTSGQFVPLESRRPQDNPARQ